ncbi:hypothetical protein GCM10022231_31540 [Gordonia caeni]|uniref:Cupin domain-containing protein n=2 Tax=Gordonia caeni TaxID=1007097 RepID=A0ABP7PML8_9ACTN
MHSDRELKIEHGAIVVQGPDDESTLVNEFVNLETVPGTTGAGTLLAAAAGRGEMILYQFPSGFENDFHNTPVPTWMIFLSGALEVTTSDGSTSTFTPGGIVRFTDASGPGHRSRVVSSDDVMVAAIHMPD